MGRWKERCGRDDVGVPGRRGVGRDFQETEVVQLAPRVLMHRWKVDPVILPSPNPLLAV